MTDHYSDMRYKAASNAEYMARSEEKKKEAKNQFEVAMAVKWKDEFIKEQNKKVEDRMGKDELSDVLEHIVSTVDQGESRMIVNVTRSTTSTVGGRTMKTAFDAYQVEVTFRNVTKNGNV